MFEITKNKPFVILATIALLLFVLNIGSCVNSYNQRNLREKERFQRMDLEERMSKFNQEKAILTEKLKVKDKELDAEITSHQATKKALIQEQMVVSSLKDELQKVTKLKEALEEEIKKSLSSNKKAKK